MEDLLIHRDTDLKTTDLMLNRPRYLNALTPALVSALIDALGSIMPDAVAVVIRGAGRAFCSGADLGEIARAEERGEPVASLVPLLQDLTRSIRACAAPVIAAVHGYAVGGGAELALSCDLVIADGSAKIGFPETGIATTVTGGLTALLPRIVGLVRAKELVLLGEFMSADRAAELGLVNQVVPIGTLDDGVRAIIERLRTRSANAVRANKQLLDAGFGVELDTVLEREFVASRVIDANAEAQQARLAFARKHPVRSQDQASDGGEE